MLREKFDRSAFRITYISATNLSDKVGKEMIQFRGINNLHGQNE